MAPTGAPATARCSRRPRSATTWTTTATATVDNARASAPGLHQRRGRLRAPGHPGLRRQRRRLTCNAVAGQPAAEICDGIDNDCDGQVDDVAGPRRPLHERRGRLQPRRQPGLRRGGAASSSATRAPATPWPRRCDGVDNDCDGLVGRRPAPRRRGRLHEGVGECVARGPPSAAAPPAWAATRWPVSRWPRSATAGQRLRRRRGRRPRHGRRATSAPWVSAPACVRAVGSA